MAGPFCYYLRVRYSECDPQKVVFNSRYSDYVDTASTEFFKAIGFCDAVASGELETSYPARIRVAPSLRPQVSPIGSPRRASEQQERQSARMADPLARMDHTQTMLAGAEATRHKRCGLS
jgi:hypothetical protein